MAITDKQANRIPYQREEDYFLALFSNRKSLNVDVRPIPIPFSDIVRMLIMMIDRDLSWKLIVTSHSKRLSRTIYALGLIWLSYFKIFLLRVSVVEIWHNAVEFFFDRYTRCISIEKNKQKKSL